MGEKCRPRYCVCGCVLPQRLVMAIISALGVIVCCGQREEKSVGIAVYINDILRSNYSGNTTANVTHIQTIKIDMSNVVLNLILAAFPVGHFIAQIPAGALADGLGGRWLYFGAVATSTVLTFISPLIIRYSNILIVHFVRVSLGVAQSIVYPCISVLLIEWSPIQERGKFGGMTYAMYPLGVVLADAVGERLRMRDIYDWPTSFYIWGSVGVIWCAMYIFLLYETPETHPRITDKEKEYLKRILPQRTKMKSNFKEILSNHGIWALIIGQIGHNFTLHLMIVDVPWNLNKVAHVPTNQAILSSLIPFIGFWIVSILSGIVMDYGVVKKHWNLKWTRRIATYINFVIPNTFLCFTYYVREYHVALITCYAIAILFSGPYGASFRINHMDITINFVGIVTAFINFFGDIVAFILFVILRIVTKQETEQAWEINTWVAFCLNFVCSTHYLLAAQVDRAKWDYAPEENAEITH